MTAAEAMASAAARLRAAGVRDPARDARVLLAHAAQIDAARVTLIAPEDISLEISERYDHLVSLRCIRVPVSHLTGRRAFFGRDFQVSKSVLDPRPETETLIEAALAAPFSRVLDLGTGSGCILVTLLAERPKATGVGVDLSESACLEASANAVAHGVAERVAIQTSDWFDTVEGRFDLIVANPPYIAADEMPGLDREVREHEPRMALTDEADGLTAYRTIAAHAGEYLEAAGRVLCEIGATQGRDVAHIFDRQGWSKITVLTDLDGRDRVVCAQNPA
ncbi:MAG: peptide chain release factor N(5)-glutamine methyltransferase [Pseudomonadota bacterium]